jgi:hypothetical protein
MYQIFINEMRFSREEGFQFLMLWPLTPAFERSHTVEISVVEAM